MSKETKGINVAEVREKLSKAGPRWWRSLEEVAETEGFKKWVEDEFPDRASLLDIDRRKFLQLTGAAVMMASLAGCRRLDKDEIVPFVKTPEDSVPGKPEYYASSFVHGGYATGILVESRQGRPTKIEGNPIHPASKGKASAITLASIYSLYDPFRSQAVSKGRATDSFENFLKDWQALAEEKKASGGPRVAILTETVTSPTLDAQIKKFSKKYPQTQWYVHQSCNRDNVFEGTAAVFGQRLNPVYHIDKADVIVSLDSDFLLGMLGSVRYANDFATRRAVNGTDISRMSRLYAVESAPSTTGATADHRIGVKASEVEAVARELANAVGVSVPTSGKPSANAQWIAAVAKDLQAARGRCLVIPGDHLAPAVHAIAHTINHTLGNLGQTVSYTDCPELSPGIMFDASRPVRNDLVRLTAEMNAGNLDALFILGANPVYASAADVNFADALAKVPFSVHFGMYKDETGERTVWHIPESHYLEAWGDARAYDGTVSLQQPLIAPLYSTVTATELLEQLSGGTRRSKDILKDQWKTASAGGDVKASDHKWNQMVHDGMIRDSALTVKSVSLMLGMGGVGSLPAAKPIQGMEAVFLPDPTVYDGRYAPTPWLQELPKPMTGQVWDNTILMSPITAEKLGVGQREAVEVKTKAGSIVGATWLSYGQADDLLVLHMGYGRDAVAPLATFDDMQTRGYNANHVRSQNELHIAAVLEAKKTGDVIEIADSQEQHQMTTTDGDIPLDIARSGASTEFENNPNFAPDPEEDKEPLESLYNDNEFSKYDGYKWAMTIDLGLCTGCGACATACQSENNIPSVGKLQVVKGRIMHWIRIDRYYKGGLDKPSETLFQPVTCQQCENAPCEPVCPVAATTHSQEGLNQMIYNRCVGTRYCSNNCPYKVRRFNYLNFADKKDYPTLTLLNNPDVSVRGRGVMEKCTYCVQRINVARIESKKANRKIKDGEVVTACQQACPSNAIIFGDINDKQSAISQSKSQPRNYTLLKEVNTRPRTTYLARVRNVNPELVAIEGAHGG